MPKTAILFALAFLLAACGAPPPAPVKPETQKFTQPLLLRVLDSRDRPVSNAQVDLTAKKGSPMGALRVETDKHGEAAISWRPQVVDLTAGSRSRDEVFDLVSQLEFTISKTGFFPARGRMETVARGRRLYDPDLKPLDREPVLSQKTETVVLRRPEEVFGGQLKGKPLNDPLVERLMKFHESMALVAPHLGVDFAWPAFVSDGKKLFMHFNWQGASWAGLSRAPLLGQVTAGSLLPLARAVGEELSGLPGVNHVALQVLSKTTPEGDPHALPSKTRITLTAPLDAYLAMAANKISSDEFLLKFPPSLSVEKPPRSTQSAPAEPEPDTGKESR